MYIRYLIKNVCIFYVCVYVCAHVQIQDLVAAMDSYRSEHERTMAGKEKTIENLKLQLQQHRNSKVRTLIGIPMLCGPRLENSRALRTGPSLPSQ